MAMSFIADAPKCGDGALALSSKAGQPAKHQPQRWVASLEVALNDLPTLSWRPSLSNTAQRDVGNIYTSICPRRSQVQKLKSIYITVCNELFGTTTCPL
jgi:hypothetical protein